MDVSALAGFPCQRGGKPAQKPWPTSTGSLCESLLFQELKHQSGACAWILQLEEVSRVGYEVVVETDQPARSLSGRKENVAVGSPPITLTGQAKALGSGIRL